MAIKKNEVVRISLRGGLIGWFTVNPRWKIEKAVEYYNERGYNLHQVVEHTHKNPFIQIVRFLVLLCTMGFYTFDDGYLLIFEKEVDGVNTSEM